MHLLIIGSGYVGLVTGACFAEMGHNVTCLDIDAVKVEKLKNGIIPIFEPSLDELVKRNRQSGTPPLHHRLSFRRKGAEVCFIAVPTPSDTAGSCDLSYVFSAAEQVARHMTSYKIVVNKSTVPSAPLPLSRSTCSSSHKSLFDVVSNPEFLKEGIGHQRLHEARPDHPRPRQPAGDPNDEGPLRLVQPQPRPAPHHGCPLRRNDKICRKRHARDPHLVHERARRPLRKDRRQHQRSAHRHRLRFPYRLPISLSRRRLRRLLLPERPQGAPSDGPRCPVTKPPSSMPSRPSTSGKKSSSPKRSTPTLEKRAASSDKTIAIWGLSFKPDTDDIREAPSLELIQELLAAGATLRLFDPVSMHNAKNLLGDHPTSTGAPMSMTPLQAPMRSRSSPSGNNLGSSIAKRSWKDAGQRIFRRTEPIQTPGYECPWL